MESGNDILRQDDLFAMHSVIVEFGEGLEELDELYMLESELTELVEKQQVGMLDGHEVAVDNSHGYIFLYGKNAEQLFKAIHPLLQKCKWLEGAVAHLRFGPAQQENAPEISIHV